MEITYIKSKQLRKA